MLVCISLKYSYRTLLTTGIADEIDIKVDLAWSFKTGFFQKFSYMSALIQLPTAFKVTAQCTDFRKDVSSQHLFVEWKPRFLGWVNMQKRP